jgi:hypothetical protein
VAPKAWQRVIREQHQAEDPRPPLESLTGCWVEPMAWGEAEEFILKYEWLGTMGRATATYGLRAPDGELIGVACFGLPGAAQSRDLCGKDRRSLAICLERGACSHRAPANASSFLISRATKMAADEHGWRVFYAYGDPEAGEFGTVYQACNWRYVGQGVGRGKRKGLRADFFIPDENKTIANRTLHCRGLTEAKARALGWIPQWRHPKHKYVHFEGTRTERKGLLAALRYSVLPYPQRAEVLA